MGDDIVIRDCLGTAPPNVKVKKISGEKWVASCLISASVFGDFMVTAETVLVKTGIFWELAFMIVRHNYGGGEPIVMYRSEEARPYIHEDKRAQVIDVACASLEALLKEAVRPLRILRELKEPHKQSLRLHDRITEVLSNWGYCKEHLSERTADHIWVHRRV